MKWEPPREMVPPPSPAEMQLAEAAIRLMVRLPGHPLGLLRTRRMAAAITSLRAAGARAELVGGGQPGPREQSRPTATRTGAGALAGGLVAGPLGAVAGGLVGHASRKRGRRDPGEPLRLVIVTAAGVTAETPVPARRRAQAEAFAEAFNRPVER